MRLALKTTPPADIAPGVFCSANIFCVSGSLAAIAGVGRVTVLAGGEGAGSAGRFAASLFKALALASESAVILSFLKASVGALAGGGAAFISARELVCAMLFFKTLAPMSAPLFGPIAF